MTIYLMRSDIQLSTCFNVAVCCALLEEGEACCFAHIGHLVGLSVGISISLKIVKWITQKLQTWYEDRL